jgi:hypothetical protein
LGRGKDKKNTILTLEFKFEYKSAAQQLMAFHNGIASNRGTLAAKATGSSDEAITGL